MPAVRRRYFILIFVPVFLLALLLAGWAARLHLAERLATSSLQQAGLEAITADIQHLDLEQTQLSQLNFQLPTNSGRLTLEAKDISISYQPEKLINGDIDRLEINTLIVYYTHNAEPEGSHAEPRQTRPAPKPEVVLETLATVLEKYILFDDLSIHQITLHGEAFAALDGKTLSLVSRLNDGALYAELTLLTPATENPSQNRPADLPRLVITRLSKDALEAELRPAQASGDLPAKIKLVHSDKKLNGNYQLSPRAMQDWLHAVNSEKDFAVINTLSKNQSSILNGTFSLDFKNSDLWHATLNSTAKRLSSGTYSTDNIALDIRLAYSATSANHKLKLLDGTSVRADKVNAGDSIFTDSNIKLTGELTNDDNHWQYKGTVSSKQLTARFQSQQDQSQQLQLADIRADIKADISADTQQLTAEGRFSPATLPGEFSFLLDHNLSKSTGTIEIQPATAIDLSAETDHLGKLLTPWPYPFDLYTGKINISADASWSKDKATRLRTDINLDDSGGSVGSIVFSGLSFDHKLEILPAVKSIQASEIKLNTVDSGVTISNISLRLTAKTSTRGNLPRMIVRQTKGEILGGNFTADDLVYDLNRSKNRFLIKVNNIDLAEVVKTQQLQNITATGRLDGTLPVEINKDGINIVHGSLINQIRGGTIRYIPESGTDQLRQNPITGITLDALKNFRYSDLHAGVNYLPDGELTINLELKGISPELDENRPVHLNINTEQNLVSLLKSLRFAQGVSGSIDEQVRRMYQQTGTNK